MVCRYCGTDQPEEAFEVCRVGAGKAYRRRKCQKCKRLTTNARTHRTRVWLNEYKQSLSCERCGFADFRALEFHHDGPDEKSYNVGDMLRGGMSRRTIEREISKCRVLCSNCHQIEHYEARRRSEPPEAQE